jgi:hypothetical protein
MRVNEWQVLQMAIEDGVRYGVRKAYKHSDSNPPDEDQVDHIIEHTINCVSEWFTPDITFSLTDIEALKGSLG